MMFDAYTHVLIIEIDEEAHDTSEYCSCENKRMMELVQDVGCRPTVFIRINPDGYTGHDGRRQPSCFKRNKKGLCVVGDVAALDARLNLATSRIQHHINFLPEREVTVEHLYYDGFI